MLIEQRVLWGKHLVARGQVRDRLQGRSVGFARQRVWVGRVWGGTVIRRQAQACAEVRRKIAGVRWAEARGPRGCVPVLEHVGGHIVRVPAVPVVARAGDAAPVTLMHSVMVLCHHPAAACAVHPPIPLAVPSPWAGVSACT